MEEKDLNKGVSRRDLMLGVGTFAIGAAVAQFGGLASKATAKEAPKFPYPYKKLDLNKVGERAYENWYNGFCTYAVVQGVLGTLQDEVGEPYSSLPLEAFIFGHGGVVGWGTACGTIIGAGLSAGFVAGGPKAGSTGEMITNEVIHYYAETALPIFEPKNSKMPNFTPVTCISDSPLCHISTNRWSKKSGFKFATPQRKDRCARLAANVAMQTATLLNQWQDGKFEAKHDGQIKLYGTTSQNNCTDCHGAKVPSAT